MLSNDRTCHMDGSYQALAFIEVSHKQITHKYVPINIYHLFIHSFVSCYNSAGGLGD